MARDDTPIKLRPVDDENVVTERVIRIGDGPAINIERLEPVRLDPSDSGEVEHKLLVPNREGVDTRTHQPSIELLIGDGQGTTGYFEEGWGAPKSDRRGVPWGWFALLGIGAAGIMAWAVSSLKEGEVNVDVIRVESQALVDDDALAHRQAVRLIEQIREAVRAFAQADSLQGLLEVSRFPRRVKPMMESYYKEHSFAAFADVEVVNMQPLTAGSRAEMWMADAVCSDGRTMRVLIEADGVNPARVDWELAVCYQPMPWRKFAERKLRDVSLDFRLIAKPDLLHSHEFSDETIWRCVSLTDSEGEVFMYGYVRQGTVQAELLESVMRASTRETASIIARLRIPEGLTSPRGVLIEEILSGHWFYIEEPKDPLK